MLAGISGVRIQACTFAHATSNRKGGAIFSYGNMSVNGSLFHSCACPFSGGAIHGTENILVDLSSFKHITASRGGAIYGKGHLYANSLGH